MKHQASQPIRRCPTAGIVHFCAMVWMAGLLTSSAAPPAGERTMEVQILLQPSGVVLNGQASRVIGNQLEMRNAIGSTVRLPFESIESVEFKLPENLAAASESYRLGDLETALPLYHELRGFESLVGVPGSNIGQEFLDWADTLRQLRQFSESEKVLRSVDFSENDEARNRALLIRAFIHCDRNEIDEAARLMEEFVRTDRGDENFPLERIVQTRIHLARGESHLAALTVGESLAGAPIESPVYPELLYLAAQTYAKMQEKTGDPDLTGQGSVVDRLMGESIDYEALVEGVRQHLSFIFPDSFWAQQAPANVDELLARAAGLTLKGPEEKTEEEAPAAESPPDEPPPSNPWQRSLDPTTTPNTDQP